MSTLPSDPLNRTPHVSKAQRSAGFVTASLDLQIPALQQHDNALAYLRSEFGKQGCSFPRFDIAYAVFWERIHPHLQMSRDEIPFINESEILSDIADGMSDVPIARTALALLRGLSRTERHVNRWREVRQDEVLSSLDSLSTSELADATTYLFADDLAASLGADRRAFLVIDAYESVRHGDLAPAGLVPSADSFLRDLCSQFSPGVVAIGSRSPVDWSDRNSDWSTHMERLEIGGLPDSASEELLETAGIEDPRERRRLVDASTGLPLSWNLPSGRFGDSCCASRVDME